MRRALAVASLVLAVPCGAQSLRVGDACVLPLATDTVDAIMVVQVGAFDPRQRIPADYATVLAQEVARHLVVPSGMQMNAFHATRADSSLAYPAEVMMAAFTLDRRGSVVHLAPVTRSMSPAFDALAFAALTRASEAAALPPPPSRARGDSLHFRLTMSVGERIESGEVLAARMRIPAWRLSRVAWPVTPVSTPQYPPDMRRGNIEGEVVVDFVVGTDSLPVLPTIRVVRHTDMRFWEEVRKVLPRNRVAPGMVGDCPVATRVRQPFNFRLR